jgi:hypothetical protein
MYTIIFVETPENKGKMTIGFQLCNFNYSYSPKGLIRIARFNSAFLPDKNLGYYGDIYMKRFIRKWKNITKKNIERRNELKMAEIIYRKIFCNDIYNNIIEYL